MGLGCGLGCGFGLGFGLRLGFGCGLKVILPEPSRSMCLKMRYQDCLVGTGSILAICMLSRLESAATSAPSAGWTPAIAFFSLLRCAVTAAASSLRFESSLCFHVVCGRSGVGLGIGIRPLSLPPYPYPYPYP